MFDTQQEHAKRVEIAALLQLAQTEKPPRWALQTKLSSDEYEDF